MQGSPRGVLALVLKPLLHVGLAEKGFAANVALAHSHNAPGCTHDALYTIVLHALGVIWGLVRKQVGSLVASGASHI